LLRNVKILHEQMRSVGVMMLCSRLHGEWKTLSVGLSLSYLQMLKVMWCFMSENRRLLTGRYWIRLAVF